MRGLIGFFSREINTSLNDNNGLLKNVNIVDKRNSNQLGIFHLNVQCLNNKTDMLSLYLRDADFDVLCISEHWQDSREIINQCIPGYVLRASFCRDRLRHGGVAIYTIILCATK